MQPRMLDAINRAQSSFISNSNDNSAFELLLSDLLALTASEYGFIGEVLRTPQGDPYLKTHAITNIAWNDATRKFYDENAPRGMEFHNLKTLFGAVLTTAQPVIANEPQHDCRRGGLPAGHPPLNAFLGIPILVGEQLVAMAGISNRPGGYDQTVLEDLQPLLVTIGQLVQARRNQRERQATEAALEKTSALLAGVLDAASEVSIIATDPQGLITVFNRGAEHLLGFTADEMIGRQTPAIIHLPAEVDARARELSAELAYPVAGFRVFVELPEKQGAEQREWTYVRKDGTTVPVSLVVTAMRAASGEITGYLGIAQNIAERKRAEQDLNQFKGTLDRTLDCVFMFDAHTLRFFYANQGALHQVGYELDELLSMHPYDIKPDISAAQFREMIAPLLGGRQASATFETVHQHKNGGRLPVEVFLQYIAPAGESPRFVAIVRDISERKAVEADLRESERRFRHMLETSPTAARIAAAGGREVIFSNRRYAELINASPGQVTGVDPATYYANPRDYADIISCLEKGEQIHNRLVELRIPGAGTKWALASYYHIQYQGRPAILGWFYDITDRKRAEAVLEEQASHTQAILNNMVDGLITIDQRGIVASFNPAAERIFGYRADEVLGQNVAMLMPNPHRDAHDGYLRNYHATGVARVIGIGREVEGLRKDGSLFPMELAVSEVTRQGAPLYVGMVRDISERKRMERMKSEFVSTVSHELRTPLTSISGALGLLAGGALGALPDPARSLIEIAHKNSQRLTHLINDLLDMEKIVAGKMHFDMQIQALMPLVEQALESNRAYGAERRIGLALRHRADGAEVQADSLRLTQVLSNLLSNAIKYSPDGGTVEILVAQEEGRVRTTVTDHGPGIPATFHSRIFQKFSQADSSDTRQKGGTGLGLAISKELVERMGGRIGFESVEGQGASFFFDLPLCNAREERDASLLLPDKGSGDAPRILVVEDEPDIARLLGLMLARAGYAVDTALNGADAIQAMKNGRYAAITLDLMLPDISGLEVIRQMRQQPETAALPIVVVSAKMEEGRLAFNGDFSGIDWLAKPIDESRLLAAVGKCRPQSNGMRSRILHVEDDPDLHEVIRAMGGSHFEFELATTLADARARIALDRFDVVILDLGLPDGSGWDLLPILRAQQPPPRVVILSGNEMSIAERKKVEAALLKSRISPGELLDAIKAGIHQSQPIGFPS